MVLFKLNGVYSKLYLHDDKIVIKRKGTLSKLTQWLFKCNKSIYLTQISSIKVREGTTFINGYIQFTLTGGNQNTKEIINATKDKNSIIFAKSNNKLVEEIKLKIEEIKQPMEDLLKLQSGSEEIIKYKELLDQKIITEEEFAIKKNELSNL